MQIRAIVLGACCFALGVPAIGQAATLSKADRQFLDMVATTDMTEAHEGQMAEDQANRADVKDLAKTLVEDHTTNYEHLNELAAKAGISIPKGIDTAKDREIQALAHLKGNRFDSQFDKVEVADHERAIAVFKREEARTKDPDVKAFVADTIPVLEKHLHLAQECAKHTGKS